MTKQNRLVVISLSGLVWGVLILVHVFLCVHNSRNHRLVHILHGHFVTAFTISFLLGLALGYVLYIVGERAILYLWKMENRLRIKLLSNSTPRRRRVVIVSALLGLTGFLSWKLASAIFFGYRYARWIDHRIGNTPCQPHHVAFSLAWVLAGFVVFEISIWYSALFTYVCMRISTYAQRRRRKRALSP